MKTDAPNSLLEPVARSKRRIFPTVLILLGVWQAGSMALAVFGRVRALDEKRIEFGESHSQIGLSLLFPAPTQLAEALARIQIERQRNQVEGTPEPYFEKIDVSSLPPHMQAAESERKNKRTKALRELLRGRYWTACEYFQKSKHYEDQRAKWVCTQLDQFGPPDVSVAGQLRVVELMEPLIDSYDNTWSIQVLWRIFDDCRSTKDMITVINKGRRFHAREYGFWRIVPPCSYNTAVARLNSVFEGNRDATGEAIAVLADAAQEEKDTDTALYLYRLAAMIGPAGPAFGRARFNEGFLLRSQGRPLGAIRALNTIFDSRANDRDPGSNLMSAYRNYRHRSALEIGDAYSDAYNFPMSYYYQYLAANRYHYQSWCGTCMWGAEAQMRKRLFNTSLAAGPLFAAFNLLAAPLVNWRIWLILGCAHFLIRKLRRKNTLAPNLDH